MENKEIARVLWETADLMEIAGEDSFRIRSYRNGATAIEGNPERVIDMLRDPNRKITEIPGIGKGLAAVLQSTFPAFGLVIAHLYLPYERLTTRKVFGVLMGVAGVAIIFSDQLTIAGHLALLGSVALVASAFFGAYSNVLVKAYAREIDPQVLAAGQMIFGFPPLLIIGIATEGNPLRFHWTMTAVISLAYLVVVGSVIAFALYYWLVRHMEVTKTMLIALVTPVVAVLLGMIVLHEKLNWRLFAGAACIISGIGLIVLRNRQKTVSTSEDEADLIPKP